MTLLTDVAQAIRLAPMGHYQLFCHTNVYQAIQRMSDIQPNYDPHPWDRLFGADVVVAVELGPYVWELYSNGKLAGYGRMHG